jgi:hypothetical protein
VNIIETLCNENETIAPYLRWGHIDLLSPHIGLSEVGVIILQYGFYENEIIAPYLSWGHIGLLSPHIGLSEVGVIIIQYGFYEIKLLTPNLTGGHRCLILSFSIYFCVLQYLAEMPINVFGQCYLSNNAIYRAMLPLRSMLSFDHNA